MIERKIFAPEGTFGALVEEPLARYLLPVPMALIFAMVFGLPFELLVLGLEDTEAPWFSFATMPTFYFVWAVVIPAIAKKHIFYDTDRYGYTRDTLEIYMNLPSEVKRELPKNLPEVIKDAKDMERREIHNKMVTMQNLHNQIHTKEPVRKAQVEQVNNLLDDKIAGLEAVAQTYKELGE